MGQHCHNSSKVALRRVPGIPNIPKKLAEDSGLERDGAITACLLNAMEFYQYNSDWALCIGIIPAEVSSHPRGDEIPRPERVPDPRIPGSDPSPRLIERNLNPKDPESRQQPATRLPFPH